jgi:hypothetical protein
VVVIERMADGMSAMMAGAMEGVTMAGEMGAVTTTGEMDAMMDAVTAHQ